MRRPFDARVRVQAATPTWYRDDVLGSGARPGRAPLPNQLWPWERCDETITT
ncbi:MAG: hypothetical protein HGA45_17265 [Chloroflexales bacterium]|nr:hypothetical protein [Chloroflexales bacterium]